jgi:hypothetical protein
MASTRSGSCGGLVPTGVDYCWASSNRPDWFTLDTNGHRIQWSGYEGVWQMDVGTQAYQDKWAANVVAELRANGWDGVVVDNANVDESWYLGARTMREYPTQPSYEAATRSFLARACPQVIAAGFLCLPNIQAHPTLADADLWADWTQFTSGGTREYWMKWGMSSTGRFGEEGWSELQRVFETVQAAGKIFIPVTYAPLDDVQSMRYARASFLLGWNGGPSAFVLAPSPEPTDPWSPEWTAAVGTPTGQRYRVGALWRRDFSEGTVLVNHTPSRAEIALGGTYALPDSSHVTSVSLAPLSGAVLRLVEPDTTAPETTLDWRPPDPASAPTAVFRFASNEAHVRYLCRFDGVETFAPCASPKIYTALRDGTHTFEVFAVDAAGNADSSPAGHVWTTGAGGGSLSLAARRVRSGARLGLVRRSRWVVRGRVSSTELAGDILAAAQEGRRTIVVYRQMRRGWRAVRSKATGPRGGFEVRVRLRPRVRGARIFAVAYYDGWSISSRVLTIRRRG